VQGVTGRLTCARLLVLAGVGDGCEVAARMQRRSHEGVDAEARGGAARGTEARGASRLEVRDGFN
jgi:hypothetical protein